MGPAFHSCCCHAYDRCWWLILRSFTNKPFEVPGGERTADWEVMPPGHFIAGKSSRLKQFALTPEQLHQREVRIDSFFTLYLAVLLGNAQLGILLLHS